MTQAMTYGGRDLYDGCISESKADQIAARFGTPDYSITIDKRLGGGRMKIYLIVLDQSIDRRVHEWRIGITTERGSRDVVAYAPIYSTTAEIKHIAKTAIQSDRVIIRQAQAIERVRGGNDYSDWF